MNLGDNIEAEIEGSILTLTIDLSKTFGVSSSGKSETIATTRGNKALDGSYSAVKVGINVYKPMK